MDLVDRVSGPFIHNFCTSIYLSEFELHANSTEVMSKIASFANEHCIVQMNFLQFT